MDENPIQTASSLGLGGTRNSDGTITIRCRECFNPICDVDGRNRFFSAICEVCSREAKGEIVPAEIEAQMRTMRMPSGQRIPMSAFAPVADPMIGNEKKVGTPDYWFRVVKQKIQATVQKVVKKKKVYVEKTAQELANERRHKPLFSDGIEINIKNRNRE